MASFPISLFPSLPPSPTSRKPICRLRRNQWIGRGGRIGASYNGLELLYDDGYQNATGLEDYVDAVSDLLRFDHGGPPRWFCPADGGPPIKNAPLLLFLPGVDGIGLGLLMHHKALGRIFEVRCMHVPVYDRTPFEGLVKFVEDVLRFEHSMSANKPIYLIGHSFGGCLALAVAAHNPDIKLMVVLSNPATSFEESQMQPLLSALAILPNSLNLAVPYLLSLRIYYQVKMALDAIGNGSHPLQRLKKLSRSLSSPLLQIANLLDTLPRETFAWKLKLLKSAASYANSWLHAVKAEVLVLASCNDSLLPSKDEAKRLQKSLLDCRVHYFEDHSHSLLLESGIHLSTIIKCTNFYHLSRRYDCISDYLPPTLTELKELEKASRCLYQVTSPVMFSTMEDGKIVRSLSGIPDDGPVVLIGNHMLLGLELIPFAAEFLREKGVLIHGIGHPYLFERRAESSSKGHDILDFVKLFGAVPVSGRYLYRLLSEKSFVLLHPGGSREALHRKGEEYKLFWPSQPEFVRMAAQFGAAIIPFGVVGEDDLGELVLDCNDMMSLLFVKDKIKACNKSNQRDDKQDLFLPLVCPKIPGRFYYLFGKPIITSGKAELLKDRQRASALYFHVKTEVECIISYLLKKRKEDIYRGVVPRTLYQAVWGCNCQVPTFEP